MNAETSLNFNDRLIARFSKNKIILKIMLGTIRAIFKVVALPVIRNRHPWSNPELNTSAILPINQELKFQEVLLPYTILTEIIEKASPIMLMNICGCRVAYQCKNYPRDIGCLFMGPGVLKISPGLGRIVSKEEALEHIKKAIEAGLIPFIGRAEIDKVLFQMPKDARFIGLCFCCHCCCLANAFSALPIEHLNQIFRRLPGLRLEVTDKCTGCGTCLDFCLFHAITIENGRAVHTELCRGCGRCADKCPSQAINISLESSDFKERVIKQISQISKAI